MKRNQNAQVEEDISDQSSTTVVYLLIEYVEQRTISAAIFNNIYRKLQVCTFLDNQHYVSLESFLIQVNPKQKDSVFKVYFQMPEIVSERKKILSKFQDLEATLRTNKITATSSTIDSIIQPKLRFLLQNQLKFYIKELQNKKSAIALNLLIHELELQQQKTNKQQFILKLFQNNSYMKLDKACLNALNIFPKNMQKKLLTTNSTLYDILNKCKTAFGTRCLKRWMKQPLQNENELQYRLQLVEYFIDNQAVKNIIQNQLKKLPDLEKIYYIFYKVQSGKKVKCQVSDLIKLHRVIISLSQLIENIEKRGLHDEIIQKIHKQLKINHTIISKLAIMIQKSIDMSSDRPSQQLVRAQAQPNLSAIQKSMNQIQKEIKKEQESVAKYLKGEVDIIESATYRYVFESLKKGYVEKVKDADNYKFLTAKQTKISFTTDNMIRLCNAIMQFETQYKQAQQEVLNKMFKVVAGYYPVMEKLSSTLSELDVLIGWSTIVSTSTQKWARPSFGSRLLGLQMRHPCVKQCIPNDININHKKTVILTGPNMGGKSTYIRTIGVCSYLAHIGMYVPAAVFECPIIDAIICRVGASDQQIKGISTFMGEMIQTACMLKTATNKSLVLIDELGRGTSTNQGFGLSWALCKYLHTKINPYCMFATHFHEMIGIQDQVQGISNMYTSCKIVDDKIQFEYRVLEGKIEKSYGIQVAKMLEFPQEIIQDAEQYLQVYENKEKHNKFNLTQQQELHVYDLINQMNDQIQKCLNIGNKNQIKEKYHNKIRQIVKGAKQIII